MNVCILHRESNCHICGMARVRAALQVAPKPARPTPDKPDPVRDLAKARARADREART